VKSTKIGIDIFKSQDWQDVAVALNGNWDELSKTQKDDFGTYKHSNHYLFLIPS